VPSVRGRLIWLRERTWERIPMALHPLIWLLFSLSVVVIPFFDDIWMRMFFLVALYATLGMGLNVVVGMAGLLDLGFVAFFATGAYVVAIFGSPVSPVIHGTVDYWFLLPLAIGVGALFGVLLGLPVLPLRGDYLAIVTLGFGEIIRILALNMTDYTRGSSGLFDIRKPELGFRHVDDVNSFYVMMVLAALIVWFVTTRLRDSRVGRAWEAIREDEDVAAAMGINPTKYKLMAFSLGACVGALGGAIYAPFIDFVAPQSFTLLVSINVLALVIIGGMGNTTGVIAGALILVGVPELLQFQETADILGKFEWLRTGLNEVIRAFNALTFLDVGKLPPAAEWGAKLALYRFIVFGALLVAVMVLRPSGLFPSKRRELEFKNPPEAETVTGARGA
jgi:branched-chain amino acid transport system permease protein